MSRYSVQAPTPFTGTGWGLVFSEGMAETDDAALARKLARKGYTVTGNAAAKPRKPGKPKT